MLRQVRAALVVECLVTTPEQRWRWLRERPIRNPLDDALRALAVAAMAHPRLVELTPSISLDGTFWVAVGFSRREPPPAYAALYVTLREHPQLGVAIELRDPTRVENEIGALVGRGNAIWAARVLEESIVEGDPP